MMPQVASNNRTLYDNLGFNTAGDLLHRMDTWRKNENRRKREREAAEARARFQELQRQRLAAEEQQKAEQAQKAADEAAAAARAAESARQLREAEALKARLETSQQKAAAAAAEAERRRIEEEVRAGQLRVLAGGETTFELRNRERRSLADVFAAAAQPDVQPQTKEIFYASPPPPGAAVPVDSAAATLTASKSSGRKRGANGVPGSPTPASKGARVDEILKAAADAAGAKGKQPAKQQPLRSAKATAQSAIAEQANAERQAGGSGERPKQAPQDAPPAEGPPHKFVNRQLLRYMQDKVGAYEADAVADMSEPPIDQSLINQSCRRSSIGRVPHSPRAPHSPRSSSRTRPPSHRRSMR